MVQAIGRVPLHGTADGVFRFGLLPAAAEHCAERVPVLCRPGIDREGPLDRSCRVIPSGEIAVRFTELHQRNGILRRERDERFECANRTTRIVECDAAFAEAAPCFSSSRKLPGRLLVLERRITPLTPSGEGAPEI